MYTFLDRKRILLAEKLNTEKPSLEKMKFWQSWGAIKGCRLHKGGEIMLKRFENHLCKWYEDARHVNIPLIAGWEMPGLSPFSLWNVTMANNPRTDINQNCTRLTKSADHSQQAIFRFTLIRYISAASRLRRVSHELNKSSVSYVHTDSKWDGSYL